MYVPCDKCGAQIEMSEGWRHRFWCDGTPPQETTYANIHYRRYDLEPLDRWFDIWAGEYENSDAYQNGDVLLGVDAMTNRYGHAYIIAYVRRDGETIALSPYFNQSAYDYDPDYPEDERHTDGYRIEEDPAMWLAEMSGATNWSRGEWEPVNPATI